MAEPRDSIVAAQAYLSAAYLAEVLGAESWEIALPELRERKMETWPWPQVPFTPFREPEKNLAQVQLIVTQAQLFNRREFDS